MNMKFKWKGNGIKTKCLNENNIAFIECDKEYYRPLEVDSLLGDSSKAKKILNWKPKVKIKTLIRDMINQEFRMISKNNE